MEDDWERPFDHTRDAIRQFLLELPAAADKVAYDEYPWLLDQLRDPDLVSHLTTKLATAVAAALGSTKVCSPADLLAKLPPVLAVHWERDDLLLPSDQLNDEQSVWLKSFQQPTLKEADTNFR